MLSTDPALITSLVAGRMTIEVERLLADPGHPAWAAMERIADAADSDDEAARSSGLTALFAGVVEPLNDGFSPAGRAVYAQLFTHAVWRVAAREPRLAERLRAAGVASEAALMARYQGLRGPVAPAPVAVSRVVVLSRVTIGADVLLTSVVLQRLHQRHPAAELVVLGDPKLNALLGGLPKVRLRPLHYARRGPLRDRLASWLVVADAVAEERPDLVIAPDSRLDQLGILPVCPAERYRLWENVRPEGAAAVSLADQLDGWLVAVLGLPARPVTTPKVAFDAPTAVLAAILRSAFGARPIAAVKLDHGGNPAKSLPRAAEVALLADLRSKGWRILLDRGFGAEELANSDALCAAAGLSPVDLDDSGKGLGTPVAGLAPGALAEVPVIRFHGSIGGWAAALAACGLAISYDSVGHHLAAALGIPLVTAFTGHADPGFAVAWQPRGPAPVAVVEIPTADKADPAHWARVAARIPAAG
jgi:ADP-heptose:LPS heptosyltransferase